MPYVRSLVHAGNPTTTKQLKLNIERTFDQVKPNLSRKVMKIQLTECSKYEGVVVVI